MVGRVISVNEIIPGIWVGDEESSRNIEFIKKANIKVIINATRNIPCTWEKNNIEYYRLSVNDPGPNTDIDKPDNMTMLNHIPFVLNFININHTKGNNILIHCHAGIQRSATIMLIYLI